MLILLRLPSLTTSCVAPYFGITCTLVEFLSKSSTPWRVFNTSIVSQTDHIGLFWRLNNFRNYQHRRDQYILILIYLRRTLVGYMFASTITWLKFVIRWTHWWVPTLRWVNCYRAILISRPLQDSAKWNETSLTCVRSILRADASEKRFSLCSMDS